MNTLIFEQYFVSTILYFIILKMLQIVMDDHQRPDGIPVTRFTLLSIYASSDDEKLQFDYESGNTNIVVSFIQGCLFIYVWYKDQMNL